MANMRNPDLGEQLRQMHRRIERLEMGVSVPSVSLAGGGRRSVTITARRFTLASNVNTEMGGAGQPWQRITDVAIDVPPWATTCQTIGLSAGTAYLGSAATTYAIMQTRVVTEGGSSMVDVEEGFGAEVRLQPLGSPGDYGAHSNSHQRVAEGLPEEMVIGMDAYYWQEGTGGDPQPNWVYANIIALCVFSDG